MPCKQSWWSGVTGTGQMQPGRSVDDEEFLLAERGAGESENPLVLPVGFVFLVCPVSSSVPSRWVSVERDGSASLTSRRRSCHLSRQSRLRDLCSFRCGRGPVQPSQTCWRYVLVRSFDVREGGSCWNDEFGEDSSPRHQGNRPIFIHSCSTALIDIGRMATRPNMAAVRVDHHPT
jgi:hypothetical protein